MRDRAVSPFAGSLSAFPTITAEDCRSLPKATDRSSASEFALVKVLPVTLPKVNITLVISRSASSSTPDSDDRCEIIFSIARGASVRPIDRITAAIWAADFCACRASLTDDDSSEKDDESPATAPAATAAQPAIFPQPPAISPPERRVPSILRSTLPSALPHFVLNENAPSSSRSRLRRSAVALSPVMPSPLVTLSNDRVRVIAASRPDVVSLLYSRLASACLRPRSISFCRLRSISCRVCSYSFCSPCSPRSMRSARSEAVRPSEVRSAFVCLISPLISFLAARTIWRRSPALAMGDLLLCGADPRVGDVDQRPQHRQILRRAVEKRHRVDAE